MTATHGTTERLLIPIGEAAEILQVSPAMVRLLLTRGRLQEVRIGRRRLVERQSLLALVAAGGTR